jgi:two-component system chemotaxis sensor kinase CheA
MSDQYSNGPMFDMFVFETTQLLEQLEACILDAEKAGCYSRDAVNEIFRIMHTIKGSSGMMGYNGISSLAHSMEDLFYFLREENSGNVNSSELSDLLLADVDFIKMQIEKIKSGIAEDDDASKLIADNRAFLAKIRESDPARQSDSAGGRKYVNSFKAVIYFQEGCEMENIRAFNVVHNLEDVAREIRHVPEDIMDPEAAEIIRRDGFTVCFKTDCSYVDIHQLMMQTIFLKELELDQINDEDVTQTASEDKLPAYMEQNAERVNLKQQSIISVPVSKLDKLMDLMGEFVIAESMVTQNSDLKGLVLDNFQKASRQLHKITNELQDVVMSIRMVPLSATFHKMNRLVRDMCKKLEKDVQLKIIGDETEVDKNLIEHISDPLMHLVRNSLDHGIEHPEERISKGKSRTGTITLEAKNSGNDVLIIVKDDGKGLDRAKILNKATENNMINKPGEEMTDKEVYNLIFAPGFSTKENITEFSGRGVGMDVVIKNIEAIGGYVSVDSVPGEYTAFTLKIPLTLAIIDGMIVRVGSSYYTIPTISIRESFRPTEGSVFTDPDNNEMIMVRGQCYPILRLHKLFGKDTGINNLYEGTIVITEQDEKTICIFIDELVGQQQVVVKALPECIRSMLRTKWFAGCTLLGDGSISLILDISGLMNMQA